MKRTKIVCTLGPASHTEGKIRSMIKNGMDAARLNLSHGTHADHRKLFRMVRSVAKTNNKHVAVLADLQGPKIRVGVLPKLGVKVSNGQAVTFATDIDEYTGAIVPVTYKDLHKDLKAGDQFMIDDGILAFEVTKVRGKKIHAEVVNGGTMFSNKGMNFPDVSLKIGALTEKDKKDVEFVAKLGVDWISLSFVKGPEEVKSLRRLIKKATPAGKNLPRLMVKIEKHEAIDNFDQILEVADGIMIGRGDLGIEIPAEEVPIYQKEMIEKCRRVGKPVIVATQMLDSMIRNPRPTRAEVSDVANAVFDHTDAIMLSGESASGKYPVQAVKMMSKIVAEAELSPYDDIEPHGSDDQDRVTALSEAIKLVVLHKEVDGVLVSTELAPWSESVFRTHPEVPFFVAVPDATTARQVMLRWGAQPFILKNATEQHFVKRALRLLSKSRMTKKGMRLAVIMGGSHGDGYDVVTV